MARSLRTAKQRRAAARDAKRAGWSPAWKVRGPERALSYAERNAELRVMGFANYGAYLASELWQRIRAAVLAAGRRCVVCRGRASQVHHRHYSPANLRGETLVGLAPICGGCHAEIELEGSAKVPGPEVDARLRRVRREERGLR